MNIIRTECVSPRLGVRVFMLLLAWVVVASLSWADLVEFHPEVDGALADLQPATEPDLDEIRDDTATVWLVEERLGESFPIRPSLNLSFRPLATDDALLSTRSFLSKLSVYRL